MLPIYSRLFLKRLSRFQHEARIASQGSQHDAALVLARAPPALRWGRIILFWLSLTFLDGPVGQYVGRPDVDTK